MGMENFLRINAMSFERTISRIKENAHKAGFNHDHQLAVARYLTLAPKAPNADKLISIVHGGISFQASEGEVKSMQEKLRRIYGDGNVTEITDGGQIRFNIKDETKMNSTVLFSKLEEYQIRKLPQYTNTPKEDLPVLYSIKIDHSLIGSVIYNIDQSNLGIRNLEEEQKQRAEQKLKEEQKQRAEQKPGMVETDKIKQQAQKVKNLKKFRKINDIYP